MNMPIGWSTKKLRQIGKCITGLTYSPSDIVEENGLLVLRSSNVQNGKLKFNDNVYVTHAVQPDSLTCEGDILVCVRNGSRSLIGKSALISGEGAGVAHGAFMILFRTKDSAFVYQLFQSSLFYRHVHRNLGATINSINSSDFYDFEFTFPPNDERLQIAAVLSTWDTAIEKTERLIEAKEMSKKKLAHKLLFGKVRLGRTQPAGLLEKRWFSVPNDWLIARLGSVARDVSTKNQNGGKLPVLSCTKYQGLVDSLKYFDKQIFSENTSTYKVVEYGQFAYATNHIEEGSIGYQNLYPKGLVSPMYTVFKTDQKQVNDGYLYKLFKTDTFRHIFKINTSSSVDRRGSLRWTEFSKLPIPLPTLTEQIEINEVLDTVQREIDLLTKQAEAYRKQKRGLMQKLLTGQWRVKTAEEVT